jgi:ketosteroid isomerase-like protein
MKLTKKLEAEILKVYHAYWDAYLTGDVQRLSSAVADEVGMIGTVESEVFYTKADVMRFYKQTSQQLAGKAEFRNRDIRVVTVDPHIVVCEKADLYIRPEGEWILYSQLRLSTLFKKSGKRWQIFHQHGSLPDTRAQEGETIAFEKISTILVLLPLSSTIAHLYDISWPFGIVNSTFSAGS